MRRERVECLFQQAALFADLEDAEGDAGEDIVAMGDVPLREFGRQALGVRVDDFHPRVPRELVPEMPRKVRIQLEKEEFGVGMHPFGDLPAVAALARAELGDGARNGEIELAGNPADQRAGTGHDGSDLHWLFEELFKE
jgi:hypothetical protein